MQADAAGGSAISLALAILDFPFEDGDTYRVTLKTADWTVLYDASATAIYQTSGQPCMPGSCKTADLTLP